MIIAIALAIVLSIGLLITFFGMFASEETFSNIRSLETLRSKSKDESFSRGIIQKTLAIHYFPYKLTLAIVIGAIFGFGTGWIVAGIFGIMMGWVIPDITGSYSKGRRLVAEVESWEQWVSQILNLVLSGNSIPVAIHASVDHAPDFLKEDVGILSQEIRQQDFGKALDNFCDRVESSYADQIILGMKVAYESGSRISNVFADLVDTLRKEVEVAKRAESARQVANSQGILSISVALMLVVFIVIINRGYLDPFNSGTGQVVLGLVGMIFSVSIFTIKNFSIIYVRPRLLATKPEEQKELVKQKELVSQSAVAQSAIVQNANIENTKTSKMSEKKAAKQNKAKAGKKPGRKKKAGNTK